MPNKKLILYNQNEFYLEAIFLVYDKESNF